MTLRGFYDKIYALNQVMNQINQGQSIPKPKGYLKQYPNHHKKKSELQFVFIFFHKSEILPPWSLT